MASSKIRRSCRGELRIETEIGVLDARSAPRLGASSNDSGRYSDMNDELRFPEVGFSRTEPMFARDLRDVWAPPGPPEASFQVLAWKLNLALFLATVVSVLQAGAVIQATAPMPAPIFSAWRDWLHLLPSGWTFAVPLSPSSFSTSSATTSRRASIASTPRCPYLHPAARSQPVRHDGRDHRDARAASARATRCSTSAPPGPLAGLFVAIPVLPSASRCLRRPERRRTGCAGGTVPPLLGDKRVVVGVIPPGHDVLLSPDRARGLGRASSSRC